MCERITALLTGWSLYRWTGVIMDRTLGPSQTVNSPEQVQLSLSIRSVVNVCPPVDWFTCFILNLDCFLAEGYLGIMNWFWWWLRTLNQTMVIVCVWRRHHSPICVIINTTTTARIVRATSTSTKLPNITKKSQQSLQLATLSTLLNDDNIINTTKTGEPFNIIKQRVVLGRISDFKKRFFQRSWMVSALPTHDFRLLNLH
jgi:hypothetical protein